MTYLNCDLFYNILSCLDGPTLASAACTCAELHLISKEEALWENLCSSMWPSTNREDVKKLIISVGGFKKFYSECFPLIIIRELPELKWNNNYFEYPEELSEAEYYGDVDEFKITLPSDFVSIIDIRYKDKAIFSKVIWGIPYANDFNDWFYNYPFRIDLVTLNDCDEELTLSVSDGLPAVRSMERERREGKLWEDIRSGLQLSWIIINTKVKQSANLSSWSSLGGQRHWPTDNDFIIRFGSIIPAKNIVPCQVVECIIIMKFGLVTQTSIKLTELSMQLGDIEGARVNGRSSLLVLKEALGCYKSKNYNESFVSYHLYSRLQREWKEEKLRIESRLDKFCIFGGIAVLVTFCYCFI